MEIHYSGKISTMDLAYIFRQAMRLRVWHIVLWCLLMLVFVILILLPGPKNHVTSWIFFPMMIFFFGIFWMLSPSLSAERAIKQNPYFQHPISGTITPESISIQTLNANSEIKWELYQSARFCPDLILLYQNKTFFNSFLRSQFSDADWQSFNTLVNQKITGKKEEMNIRWPVISPGWAKIIMVGSLLLIFILLFINNI